MNLSEIILVISILVVGAALLRWAHLNGLKQKTYYENEAIVRLERDLQGINITKDGYELYRYIIFWGKEHGWGKVSYEEIKQDIIQNCTKYTGSGSDRYAPAEFSIYIDKENKDVYFIVGESEYDFSEIKELKSHNKSFKLHGKNTPA